MNLARYIDHTNLNPAATADDIRKLCAEAREYGFASVCVNSSRVPLAASLLGFNTAHYRNLSLAISGFYCGVSGALIAGYMSFIQPIMFDMAKSTELVSIVVFGGLGSMSGCLLGTTILTLVTELFRPISQYRMLIYGLVLVLVMVLRPEGIMGTNELTPAYLKKLFSRKKTGTAEEGAR